MPTFAYYAKRGLEIPPPLIKALRERKIKLCQEEALSQEKPEAILVLGGDGTLLRAVPLAYKLELPIIGVNLGKFGFLTKLTLEEAVEVIKNWGQTAFPYEERDVLKVTHKGKPYHTLNEGAILKGPAGRIVVLRVLVDEEEVCDIHGDGVIVSTPTGSTAYNLSAGGPIVHPRAQVFIITPICSFKIQLKPLVVPMDCKIAVKLLEAEDEVHLLLDGQTNLRLKKNMVTLFERAPRKVKLISLLSQGYFPILKEKFGW